MQLHHSLTSELFGEECSASRTCRFIPRKIAHGTTRTVLEVGWTKVGLNALAQRNFLSSARNLAPIPRSCSPQASYYVFYTYQLVKFRSKRLFSSSLLFIIDFQSSLPSISLFSFAVNLVSVRTICCCPVTLPVQEAQSTQYSFRTQPLVHLVFLFLYEDKQW